MKFKGLVLVLALLLGLCVCQVALAAELEVPGSTSIELQNAINSASTNDTIKITSSISLTSTILIDGKTLTIDLNGQTITSSVTGTNHAFNIGSSSPATVTITGNGTINAGNMNNNYNLFAVRAGSTLTVDNGTFTTTTEAKIIQNQGSVTIHNGSFTQAGGSGDSTAILNAAGAELIINGGTVEGTYCVVIGEYSKTTITGGSFKSNGYICLSNNGSDNPATSLTVSNATFNSTDTAIYLPNKVTSGVTITNCTIASTDYGVVVRSGDVDIVGTTITVNTNRVDASSQSGGSGYLRGALVVGTPTGGYAGDADVTVVGGALNNTGTGDAVVYDRTSLDPGAISIAANVAVSGDIAEKTSGGVYTANVSIGSTPPYNLGVNANCFVDLVDAFDTIGSNGAGTTIVFKDDYTESGSLTIPNGVTLDVGNNSVDLGSSTLAAGNSITVKSGAGGSLAFGSTPVVSGPTSGTSLIGHGSGQPTIYTPPTPSRNSPAVSGSNAIGGEKGKFASATVTASISGASLGSLEFKCVIGTIEVTAIATANGNLSFTIPADKLNALAEGSYDIIVSTSGDSSNYSAMANVGTLTVKAPGEEGGGDDDGAFQIDLGIEVLAVRKGKTKTLPVMKGYEGFWTVDNPAIVKLIGKDLRIRAVDFGMATLTYNCTKVLSSKAVVVGDRQLTEGSKYAIKVNVRKKGELPTGLTVGKAKRSLTMGATFQINVNVKNKKALDTQVFFVSRNPAVAVVNKSGLITALKPGKVKIRVYTANLKYKTITVTVKK